MKVQYNEKFNFNHITAEENMVFTDWDGKDIRTYSSTTEMYCPVTVDLSLFYEVSFEDDKMYKEQQEEAFKEDEKAAKEKEEMNPDKKEE